MAVSPVGHRSLSLCIIFSPLDYSVKGIAVISRWRELSERGILFSFPIVHTPGVESPNYLPSLTNLKLYQPRYGFKGARFKKVFRVPWFAKKEVTGYL